jgi:hypothetical protein
MAGFRREVTVTDGGWRSLFAEASGFLDLSPVPLEVDGAPGGLPSKLPAAQAATACVAAALTAAGGLQCQRGGRHQSGSTPRM